MVIGGEREGEGVGVGEEDGLGCGWVVGGLVYGVRDRKSV